MKQLTMPTHPKPYPISWSRHIIFSCALLFLITLIHETTRLDFQLQQYFYHDGWLLDRKDKMLKLILHEIPKYTVIVSGSVMLILWILSHCVEKLRRFKRKDILFVVLCIAIVPSISGTAKNLTNMYCPYQLQEFGGQYTYESLFQPHSGQGAGRCFPAGHASIGFSLLSLILLARTRRQQKILILATLGFSWVLGIYQMLNGNHFISHTLTSMVLAWIEILCIHRLVFRQGREAMDDLEPQGEVAMQ